MKAVCYSVKPFEKDFSAIVNQNKHDISLISNTSALDAVIYAKGKQAVIVFPSDDVSAIVINTLAKLCVQYILILSTGTNHINKIAAKKQGIQVFNIPAYLPEGIAKYALALVLSLNRRIIQANRDSEYFINKKTLAQIKDGVMLINTSCAGLINTINLIEAFENCKIGFVDVLVYENEKRIMNMILSNTRCWIN